MHETTERGVVYPLVEESEFSLSEIGEVCWWDKVGAFKADVLQELSFRNESAHKMTRGLIRRGNWNSELGFGT